MKLLSTTVLCAAMALPLAASTNRPLQKQAKITMKQARTTALQKQSGTIKSAELEKEHGKLIYSFDIKAASGIHEVQVDALSGAVVSDTTESAAAEAQEKAAEHAPKRSRGAEQKPESPQ